MRVRARIGRRRRKEEGGRRKEEGGRRKEEGHQLESMTNRATRAPVPHPLQKMPVGIEGVGKNWFAGTHFYTRLTQGHRQQDETGKPDKAIGRWTKDIDIFACDKMIIPINVRAH
jgi:hypothetical protein